MHLKKYFRKIQPVFFSSGIGGILLIIAYFNILFLLIDGYSGWVLPEALIWKKYIIRNVPFNLPSIIAQGFNWRVFEYAQRLTRPLSSSFEIIDTYFRSLVWNYFPPMPSLSLTLIFSLILGPIFFYKFCLNMGIRKNVAKAAIAFMLASQGYLSLIAMYFRPAKSMINFFLILLLYLCSEITIHLSRNEKIPNYKILAPYLITFLAFFFDETAVIIVVAILIFFPKLVFGNYKRIISAAVTICATGLAYLYGLPKIAQLLGFGLTDLTKYEVFSEQSNPLWVLLRMHLITNTRLAITESLQLFNPLKYQSIIQFILSIFLFLFAIIILAVVCYGLYRKKYLLFNKLLVFQTAVCLSFALAINNILLNISIPVTEGRVWGIYWYGTYISIFFAIFIAVALEEILKQTPIISRLNLFGHNLQINLLMASSWCFISLCIILSIINFKYINYIYYKYHYNSNSAMEIENYFNGKINRFNPYQENEVQRSDALKNLWIALKKEDIPEDIPDDLYWLPIEMKMTKIVEAGNLAMDKVATQSSVLMDGPAYNAVDGNTDGRWSHGSVTQTEAGRQPWWQVDLGNVVAIRNIKMWNRTDCCTQRLSNFYVFISDIPFESTDLNTAREQSGVSSYYIGGQGGIPTEVDINRNGRYVRVQLEGSGILSLAEVQVFGP